MLCWDCRFAPLPFTSFSWQTPHSEEVKNPKNELASQFALKNQNQFPGSISPCFFGVVQTQRTNWVGTNLNLSSKVTFHKKIILVKRQYSNWNDIQTWCISCISKLELSKIHLIYTSMSYSICNKQSKAYKILVHFMEPEQRIILLVNTW